MTAWKPLVEELVAERSPRLLAYGVMLTSSVADAEDLLHDAIIKAFAHGRKFEHANAAEQYVRRTMQTLAIDRHRSLAAARRAVARDIDPEPAPQDRDAALDVEIAMRALSAQERACVLMRYYDDLTTPAIAQHLGLADGTVKRYLSNARDKLAAALPEAVGLEPPETTAVSAKGARS